jgi:hypothetical protein
MKKLIATGGIALALLLSACATGQSADSSIDGSTQVKRQDIIQEMKK